MARRSMKLRLLLAVVAILVTVSFLFRRTGMAPGVPDGGGFDPSTYEDAPVIEAGDPAGIRAAVGSRAVVCGRVANVTYARTTGGAPTYLNLERPYPDQPFDVVIWGRDRPRFQPSPEAVYRDRRICVAGRVTTHQGTPRIEASTPAQIRVER